MPKTIRKYYKDGGGKKSRAKKERSAAKKRAAEKAKRVKEEEGAKRNEPPHRQGWNAAWSDKYNRWYWYNYRNETTWDDPAEGEPRVVPSEPVPQPQPQPQQQQQQPEPAPSPAPAPKPRISVAHMWEDSDDSEGSEPEPVPDVSLEYLQSTPYLSVPSEEGIDILDKAILALEQSQRVLDEAAEEEAKLKKEEEELENISAKILQSVLRSNQSQKQLEEMRQAKKEDKASTLLQSVLRSNQSQKDFKDRLYTIKEGNIPPEYSKRQRRIDLLTKKLLDLEGKYRALATDKRELEKELHKLKNTKTEKQKEPEPEPETEPEPEPEPESRKSHKKAINIYPRSISKEEDLLKAIEVNGWTETRKKGGHPIYKRKLTLINEPRSGTHKLEINQQVTGISTGNITKIVDELNKAEKELKEYENMGFKIT